MEACSHGTDLIEHCFGECSPEQRTQVMRLIAAVWVELEVRLHGADGDELTRELNEYQEEQR